MGSSPKLFASVVTQPTDKGRTLQTAH